MDFFSRTFMSKAPLLRKQILIAFKKRPTRSGFRSRWEYFETIANPILIGALKQRPLSIPAPDIIRPKGKSDYPDLKVLYQGKQYAIDVKSGEDKKNPWYDIGRLDRYEKVHLSKYAAEFSVVVRWKGRKQCQVIDVYIEPTYRTVGYRPDCGGVLYRPYDGKLRPKPWQYFERQKAYWTSPSRFLNGLIVSKEFRRRSFIENWYEEMSQSKRRDLRRRLSAIDAGKAVAPIDEGEDEESQSEL